MEVGIAGVVAAVELVDFRYATLLGSFAPGIENFPINPTFLNSQLTTGSVVLVSTVLKVFRALEDRQHVIPRPASITQLCPVVVVAALTTHVDHCVDG